VLQDAVWSNACCAPNMKGEATTCVRQSPMKWMCELETMVNTKAFAKTVRKACLPALIEPALASFEALHCHAVVQSTEFHEAHVQAGNHGRLQVLCQHHQKGIPVWSQRP